MRERERVTLVMAILLALAVLVSACQRDVAAPQDEDGGDISYVPLQDESLGLALEFPEGWVAHEAFSGVTLASSQAVIDGESLAEIGDGAFVNIIPGELSVFGMQAGEEFSSEEPGEVLAVYRALLENEGQTFAVRQPPQVRTVNGQHVAQMTVESEVDGERVVTIFSVITHEGQMALVSAGALQHRFDAVEPALQHVLDSIVLSSPPAAEG